MQRAYGVPSFRGSINRFVAAQPDGLAVVEHDGSVVGTGCCVAYPSGGFGWIGLVATMPGFERRGIATAITAFLGDVLGGHGCAPVLDASTAGGPVYERMGFADCGLTRVLVFAGRRVRASKAHRACAELTAADFDEVVAYDATRFGALRPVVLSTLVDQHPRRALVLRRGGKVVGYLVAQESTLAPVIADDPESLSGLLGAALRLHWLSPPRICVPPDSGHLDSLLALGFEQRRALRHMQRGIGELPGLRRSIAGLVSLGEG